MADASEGMRQGAGELETFVAGGLEATDSLGAATRAMADQGAHAAEASGTGPRWRRRTAPSSARPSTGSWASTARVRQRRPGGRARRDDGPDQGVHRHNPRDRRPHQPDRSERRHRGGPRGRRRTGLRRRGRRSARSRRPEPPRRGRGSPPARGDRRSGLGRERSDGAGPGSRGRGGRAECGCRARARRDRRHDERGGRHARAIATTAADQLRAVDGLTGQIRRVAASSARTLTETEALARRASEAATGQADLERAIRQLGDVATDLQRIARHFVVRPDDGRRRRTRLRRARQQPRRPGGAPRGGPSGPGRAAGHGARGRIGGEETAPLAGMAQPPYLNQMVLLETRLTPPPSSPLPGDRAGAGARPRERWGARTLDVDIVRYAGGA